MHEYVPALNNYLAGGGENARQRASELGHKAVEQGLSALDMAAIQQEALAELFRISSLPGKWERLMSAAGEFFMDSLSAFELAQREFQQGNTALRRLNDLLEQEAKRIAHALHDEAGQLLASVEIALDLCANDLPPAQRGQLQQVRESLNQVEEQLRRLSHELRPTILDDLGLVPALEFLAEGFTARTGVRVTVESRGQPRLPGMVEKTVYRIVQEALSNVRKHAQAKSVTIRLQQKLDSVSFLIRDDGVGFDAEAACAGNGARQSLGLLGIRERLISLGGKLRISSGPGLGTMLQGTIPLEKKPCQSESYSQKIMPSSVPA